MDYENIRLHYSKLTNYLITAGKTISTMESATGGLLASLITDTPGASAVIKGAFVTYCNEAKIMQGVDAAVLEKYTVYSKQTAEQMALACKNAYKSDIGIGITGTTGNIDPANPKASVPGTVYFAFAIENDLHSFQIQLSPQSSRLDYKMAIAEQIVLQLENLIFQ